MQIMIKITADLVYTLEGHDPKDTVVVIDDDGVILDVTSRSAHDPSTLKEYKGIITPGFINGHCHLELSHMKGLVNTGTGLLPFLESVVKYRDFPDEVIFQAIADQDEYMRDSGIVAVGDISNKIDTARTKKESDIAYYTFVEMFDFMQPSLTQKTIDQYRNVYDQQSDDGHNQKSYVPHAPYTVGSELYRFIKEHNADAKTISIHNQETRHEDQLFKSKSGGFKAFYSGFGFSLDDFISTGRSSLQSTLNHLNPKNNNIFVHNTQSTREDIAFAHAWSDQVYWATCPNANLYIENQLPDYQSFLDEDAKMIIGTDSLTSNWQLDIWEEIKTIRRYKSFVPLDTLIQWACINGARALGYDDRLGSIARGKQPGIVHVDALVSEDQEDISSSEAKRIF